MFTLMWYTAVWNWMVLFWKQSKTLEPKLMCCLKWYSRLCRRTANYHCTCYVTVPKLVWWSQDYQKCCGPLGCKARGTPPCSMFPQRVPDALRDSLKEELDRMESMQVIRKLDINKANYINMANYMESMFRSSHFKLSTMAQHAQCPKIHTHRCSNQRFGTL